MLFRGSFGEQKPPSDGRGMRSVFDACADKADLLEILWIVADDVVDIRIDHARHQEISCRIHVAIQKITV